jgi:uncharacterized membrane protein YccC
MLHATTMPDEVFDASSSQERLGNGVATESVSRQRRVRANEWTGKSPNWASAKLSLRNEVRDWVRAFRPQLRFCLRATVAALVALAIANSLNFPLHGSWMVLTVPSG